MSETIHDACRRGDIWEMSAVREWRPMIAADPAVVDAGIGG